MLGSHLVTSVRFFGRDKSYLIANLIGFSVGMAACMVAGLYLKHQLEFDQHFDNSDNIYRIATQREYQGNSMNTALSPPQLGPLLAQDTPQILNYVRFQRTIALRLFRNQADKATWDNVYQVDPNVFDIFEHEIIFGDPSSALVDPSSIAISQSVAERYFSGENPLGKTLSDDGTDRRVTLVFENLPDNTHLKYDVLLPLIPYGPMLAEGWRRQIFMLLGDMFYTYVQTAPGFDSSTVSEISRRYTELYMSDAMRESGASLTHRFEPLSDIHFGSETVRDLPRGSHARLYTLSALTITVMLVACLNFSGVALVRAIGRVKEISVRKLYGSPHSTILMTAILESIALTVVGLLTALFLANMAISLMPIDLPVSTDTFVSFLQTPQFGIVFALLVFVLCLFSCLPFTLQIANITALGATSGGSTLKDQLSRSRTTRNTILFLQFTFCALTLNLSVMMFSQLRFIESNTISFDPSNKLAVTIVGKEDILRVPQFITELSRLHQVSGATLTSQLPGESLFISQPRVPIDDGSAKQVSISHLVADEYFVDVMGIEILHGRNLDSDDPSEIGRTNLVNETLVNSVGWREPIGGQVGTWQVTGVVEDFNYGSLHQPIEPTVLRLDNESLERTEGESALRMRRVLIVAVNEVNQSETLAILSEKWSDFYPTENFDYVFLQDHLSQLYDSDRHFIGAIGLMTMLCIALAVVGLLLVSAIESNFENRNRGIRKILGASAIQLILIRLRRLCPLFVVSMVVGSLLSVQLLSVWLSEFSSQTSFGIGSYMLGPVILALFIIAIGIYSELKAIRQAPSKLLGAG